jgi:hypothetical protein
MQEQLIAKRRPEGRRFRDASMAMCALVAAADGTIDAEERRRAAGLITTNDVFAYGHRGRGARKRSPGTESSFWTRNACSACVRPFRNETVSARTESADFVTLGDGCWQSARWRVGVQARLRLANT